MVAVFGLSQSERGLGCMSITASFGLAAQAKVRPSLPSGAPAGPERARLSRRGRVKMEDGLEAQAMARQVSGVRSVGVSVGVLSAPCLGDARSVGTISEFGVSARSVRAASLRQRMRCSVEMCYPKPFR